MLLLQHGPPTPLNCKFPKYLSSFLIFFRIHIQQSISGPCFNACDDLVTVYLDFGLHAIHGKPFLSKTPCLQYYF